MWQKLSEKFVSRKLWVAILWVISALVDQDFANEIKPIVIAYLAAQGVVDFGSAYVNGKK